MRMLIASLALVFAATTPAFAHEEGTHARGTVKEVSATRLVITDQAGKDLAFGVTPSTTFLRDKAAIRPADLRVGDRAVVHAEMMGTTMTATVVKVAGSSNASK